jgi:hypothetical protein
MNAHTQMCLPFFKEKRKDKNNNYIKERRKDGATND